MPEARWLSFNKRARGPDTEFFDSSLGKLAYTVARPAQKNTIVFVHGFPTAKELFVPMNVYMNHSFRLIAVDLHGYGESAKTKKSVGLDQHAQTIEELRKALRIKKITLVGHALGASVAIAYAGKYTRSVEKLVLISPLVYPELVEPLAMRLLRRKPVGELLIALFGGALIRMAIRHGMRHKSRFNRGLFEAIGGPFRGARGKIALLRNLRWGTPSAAFAPFPEIVCRLKIDTLILQGFRDPYIPFGFVQRLSNDIPDSKLVLIHSGRHFLPMDTPFEIASEINNFLGA